MTNYIKKRPPKKYGAEGRNRTGTSNCSEDFESTAYTNFTTSATQSIKKTEVFGVKPFFG